MEKLVNIVVKVTDQATKSIQKVGSWLSNFAQKNEALFGSMAKFWAIATAWVVALGTASVMQASKLQDLRIELDTLTWSAEKWKKLFTDIQKAAAKTPFESSDLVQATSTMLQFGVAQETVMKDMMMLWDISWGNANKLKSLALVYGQVSSAGKLTWQDLLQMINLWFNPLKQISDKTGESMASLREKMEDWQISFDMVKQTMIDATSAWGLFFGMMDKKSATFSGVMSTLRDNIWVTLASIWGFSNGEVIEWGLLDKLTDAVNMVLPYLEKITNWANENPEYARNIFLAVSAVVALTTAIWLLGVAIPSIIAGFTAIKFAIVAISWPIWILTALLVGLAIYIYKNFDEIKTFWIWVWTQIKNWFLNFIASAKKRGTNLIDMIVWWIKGKINDVRNAVSNVASVIKDYLWFSSPTKKWPWSNADRWMPNLVNMMYSWLIAWKDHIWKASEELAKKIKAPLESIKEVLNIISNTVKDSFNEATSKIWQQSAEIKRLWWEYKNLKDKVKEVNKSLKELDMWTKNKVADRFMNIDSDIEAKQKQLNDMMSKYDVTWFKASVDPMSRISSINPSKVDVEKEKKEYIMKKLTNEDQKEYNNLLKELKKLQDEKLIAEKNTTQEIIQQKKAYEEMTLTERILYDSNEERKKLETSKTQIQSEMAEKKKQIEDEYALYKELNVQKRQLDLQYFLFFGQKIEEKKKSIQETIDMMRWLQSTWYTVSWANKEQPKNNNVNISFWNVSINNWKDEKRLQNTIEKTIVKAIKWQSLWFI